MLDKTVLYLEDLKKNQDGLMSGDDDSIPSIEDESMVDGAKVLEGVELRQLENYLSDVDKSRTFGNLYRSVTKDGEVKWVCRTHFKITYRENAHKEFFKIVQENRGTFDETKGTLKIVLASNSRAKAFYGILTQVQGVQELDIVLKWDVSKGDLESFSEVILKSTVDSLIVDGQAFRGGPAGDLLNRKQQYLPLLQLLARGRLQMVKFRTFDPLFERVHGLLTIKTLPRLRVLDMCAAIYGD
ncbi:hypothetical protein BG005_007422 [Podila minutissima]|nr:hypothetical protein BG005_007422 [Podila minutissima]